MKSFIRAVLSFIFLPCCLLATPELAAEYSLPAIPADQELPRFILQVGIGRYQQRGIRPLVGCENDVTDLAEVLDSRFSSPAQKWRKVQLINERATSDAIVSAFKTHLIENARKNPNAIVIFQFSGHGSQSPDRNGDEPDGLDETIVPYDGRDPGGKISDITDDELNSLFRELGQHTSNVTFILDSCHSGTGTRAGGFGGDDARRIPVDNRTRKKEIQRPDPLPVGGRRSGDSPNADILPASSNYVTISAALNTESAYPIRVPLEGGVRPNGALTFYLVQALRTAEPETTYRRLMERVSAAVSREKPQHPQVEGDVGRAIFGGSASAERPFIKINAINGRRLTIAAGRAHGIRPGALLAVYSEDPTQAPRLRGERGKLSNAVAAKVDALTAEIEMPGENKAVTKNSRVVVVSPNFGTDPLRFLDAASFLPAEVRQLLAEKNLAQIVTGPGATLASTDSFAAVRRGRFGDYKNDFLLPKDVPPPADSAEVYFLDQGDGKPAFNFFLETARTDLPAKIVDALEKLAVQRNVASLSNTAVTPELADKLKLTVFISSSNDEKSVKERPAGSAGGEGSDLTAPRPLPENSGDFLMEEGTLFQIGIENLSTKPLYVTVFNLDTAGKIKIMYPPAGANEALRPGGAILLPAYRTTPPAGREIFKAIATTAPSNFSVLEQEGVGLRGAQSPIGWLMNQAFGRTRQIVQEPTSVDSWLTAQISFHITRKGKN